MSFILHSFVRKCVSVSFLTVFFSSAASSQSTESSSHIEVGITAGPSNFLGDLGGNMGRGTTFLKDNNVQMTKLTWGAFLSYHPIDFFALRVSLNRGTLEGDDAIIKSKGGLEEARKIRNSNFKSKFTEATVLAEIYPTVFVEYDPTDIYRKFRPYAVAGFGYFKFNPQGQDPLTGQWVDLQPLRTEGQGFPEYPTRKPYKLSGLNIPLGIGVKYFLSDNVNLSFELINRKTFTDYIDDVSSDYVDPSLFYDYMPLEQAQLAERMANKTSGVFNPGDKRGTPTNKDSYYSAGFKLGIRLGNGNAYSNSTTCPIKF